MARWPPHFRCLHLFANCHRTTEYHASQPLDPESGQTPPHVWAGEVFLGFHSPDVCTLGIGSFSRKLPRRDVSLRRHAAECRLDAGTVRDLVQRCQKANCPHTKWGVICKWEEHRQHPIDLQDSGIEARLGSCSTIPFDRPGLSAGHLRLPHAARWRPERSKSTGHCGWATFAQVVRQHFEPLVIAGAVVGFLQPPHPPWLLQIGQTRRDSKSLICHARCSLGHSGVKRRHKDQGW